MAPTKINSVKLLMIKKKQALDNLYSGVPNTNTNLYIVDDSEYK